MNYNTKDENGDILQVNTRRRRKRSYKNYGDINNNEEDDNHDNANNDEKDEANKVGEDDSDFFFSNFISGRLFIRTLQVRAVDNSPSAQPLNPLTTVAAHIHFLPFLLAHYMSAFKPVKDKT